jgi:hypothetical protein
MDTPLAKKSIFEKMREMPVYLWYDFEQSLIRTEPHGNTFFKFKGEAEKKVEAPYSKLMMETMLHGEEITQEEYEAL